MNDIERLLLLANLAFTAGIVVVFALRKPVRLKFGARLAYALWLIPPLAALATLVPARVIHIVGTAPEQVAAPAADLVWSVPAAPAGSIPEPVVYAPSLDLATLLTLLWIAGAIVMIAWLARRQSAFMADLRLGKAGPAVVGFLKPRIVTPSDFEDRFDDHERRVILMHETIHLDRNDARINALLALLRCLLWYNPLVHLAAHCLRIDQELACDAAVIERQPKLRKLYADALVKAQLVARPLPLGCYWPAGTEHPLMERIAMLKHTAPTRLRRLAGAALLTSLTLGAGLAAWAAKPTERHVIYEQKAAAEIAQPPIQPSAIAIEAPAPIAPPTPRAKPEPQPIVHREPEQQAPPSPPTPSTPTTEPDFPPPFASRFDAERRVVIRGKVTRVEPVDGDITLWVTANFINGAVYGSPGADPMSWRVLIGRVSNAAPNYFTDLAPMLLGQIVEVRGFGAKGRTCNPDCLMNGRDVRRVDGFELPDGLFPTKAGAPPTTVPPATIEQPILFDKPQQAAPAPIPGLPKGFMAFAKYFDANDLMRLRGRVTAIETFEEHTALIVQEIETYDLDGKPQQYRDPTATWRVVLGAIYEAPAWAKDNSLIGKTITIRGYNARDKRCLPRCMMSGRDVELDGQRLPGWPRMPAPPPPSAAPAPNGPQPIRYEPQQAATAQLSSKAPADAGLRIVAVKPAVLEVSGGDGTKFVHRTYAAGESFVPRVGIGWTVSVEDGAAFEWRMADRSQPLGPAGAEVQAQSVDAAATALNLPGPTKP